MITRLVLAICAAAFLDFAHAKDAPSIAGSWGVAGKQKAKITLMGKSESAKGKVYDAFTFHPDGGFETSEGEWGTWTQNGTAFAVALDLKEVEQFWQAYLDSEAPPGMAIAVTVTSASLAGKENGAGTRMAGKLLASGGLVVTYLGQTMPGSFTSTTSFRGSRQAPLGKGDAVGFGLTTLLGAVPVSLLEILDASGTAGGLR